MDERFLPWWLILLVGMWAFALTAWRQLSPHRELRWGFGLATLLYFGLIFLSPGVGKRADDSATIASALTNLFLVICFAVTLLGSGWMLGRGNRRSRRLSYFLLTLSNSLVCHLMGATEIAVGLIVLALVALDRHIVRSNRTLSQPRTDARPAPVGTDPLRLDITEDGPASPSIDSTVRHDPSSSVAVVARKFGRRFQFLLKERLSDLAKPDCETTTGTPFGETVLIGLLSGVMTCLLIGTIAYSVRIETARTLPSHRYSALPSRTELIRNFETDEAIDRQISLLDLAFGKRADVVVLLAVFAFLSLARARHSLGEIKPMRWEGSDTTTQIHCEGSQ